MNHSYHAETENLRIRPLSRGDIEQLRVWRNNREETRFLRNIGYITEEAQARWFEAYLSRRDEVTFAIETYASHKTPHLIGSLALYGIDGERSVCEIGKIQIGDSNAHGKGYGRKALVMAAKIAFWELGMKKITACVHQENFPSHTNFTRIGFQIVGQQDSAAGGTEDLMEITESAARSNPLYF
ncbi:MAG: GNAT family N-acetyltransferase [Oscillibacter sp.]|nr:GNAT family N-acetyltransferase [Oscillibacter sp.]